jgi:anti-anti-sigma factor
VSVLAEVEMETREGMPVARISGEVDLSNAAEIGAGLRGSIPQEAPGLVVDLSATRYLDSAGLHVLFDLGRRLRDRGQSLRLVVPAGSPVERLIGIVGMGAVAELFSTLKEATPPA